MFSDFLAAKETQRTEILAQLSQIDMEIAAASAVEAELKDVLIAMESLINRADPLIVSEVRSHLLEKCIELGVVQPFHIPEVLQTPEAIPQVTLEDVVQESSEVSPQFEMVVEESLSSERSLGEDVKSNTESETEPPKKQKRKRRTKAEIEAEKSAESQPAEAPNFDKWRSLLTDSNAPTDGDTLNAVLDELQEYSTQHAIAVPDDLIYLVNQLWESGQSEVEDHITVPQDSEGVLEGTSETISNEYSELDEIFYGDDRLEFWKSALESNFLTEDSLNELDDEIYHHYKSKGSDIPDELSLLLSHRADTLIYSRENEKPEIEVYQGDIPKDEELTSEPEIAEVVAELTPIAEEAIAPAPIEPEITEIVEPQAAHLGKSEVEFTNELEMIVDIVTTAEELADIWQSLRVSGYIPPMSLVKKLDAAKTRVEAANVKPETPTFKPVGMWGKTIPAPNPIVVTEQEVKEAVESILPDPNWQNPAPAPAPKAKPSLWNVGVAKSVSSVAKDEGDDSVDETPVTESPKMVEPTQTQTAIAPKPKASLWDIGVSKSNTAVATDDAAMSDLDRDLENLEKGDLKNFIRVMNSIPVKFACGSEVIRVDTYQILPVGVYVYYKTADQVYKTVTSQEAKEANPRVDTHHDRVCVKACDDVLTTYTSILPHNLYIWTEEQMLAFKQQKAQECEAISLSDDPFVALS